MFEIFSKQNVAFLNKMIITQVTFDGKTNKWNISKVSASFVAYYVNGNTKKFQFSQRILENVWNTCKIFIFFESSLGIYRNVLIKKLYDFIHRRKMVQVLQVFHNSICFKSPCQGRKKGVKMCNKFVFSNDK